MDKPAVAAVLRSQTRAVFLAALLGDLGLHRFYLGQPSMGMLYLLFCWTGIPGVIASLEARRYAFMSAEAWAGLYNGGVMGKPVPRWLPPALFIMPFVVLGFIFAAIYSGWDF